MKEYKNFIKSKINSNGRSSLTFGTLLLTISAGFWIWYFIGDIETIIIPRILLLIFAFALILSPFFIWSAFKSRKPENNAVYKMLFIDNDAKKVKIQEIYANFNFSFTKIDGKSPKSITVGTKHESEIMLGYLEKFHPEIEIVK